MDSTDSAVKLPVQVTVCAVSFICTSEMLNQFNRTFLSVKLIINYLAAANYLAVLQKLIY